MKEIKAIVQPFLADRIITELQSIPELPGITVSQVRGFGRSRGNAPEGSEPGWTYVEKTKLEIVIPDELAEKAVQAIQKFGHTGNPGDGKIFVYDVQQVVRIRTGERGNQAV